MLEPVGAGTPSCSGWGWKEGSERMKFAVAAAAVAAGMLWLVDSHCSVGWRGTGDDVLQGCLKHYSCVIKVRVRGNPCSTHLFGNLFLSLCTRTSATLLWAVKCRAPLTVELLLVVLVTTACRCLRLWGGVVLVIEGGGDMLILLTGVGGALSALGRDIPKERKINYCLFLPPV